ncbi:DUF4012 domain-containing protein [Patescibacteria group bacterium]
MPNSDNLQNEIEETTINTSDGLDNTTPVQETKFEMPMKKDVFSKVKSKGKVKNSGDKKGFLKGLGVTGVVLLAVGSILALVIYLFIVSPAISLISHTNKLKADFSEISETLADRDLVELEKVLQNTETDLDGLRAARESKFGWAKDLKMFKINEFYQDSDRFINAGHLGIEALREASRIVTPFADAAGLRISEEEEAQTAESEEGLMEAFQSWVSLMPQVAEDMDGVLEILSQIGEELAPVETSKYPESIRGVPIRDNVEFAKNSLVNAKDFGPDIKKALTIVPGLLGVDSLAAKRYMVIMQNDKEIRPTGGFWTNYATFKIKEGLLQSDFTSKDFYSIDYAIDVIDAYYDFPDAPPAYAKYLKVERWYARDTNSSPDLPTSIDNFMFYYDLGMRYAPAEIKPVDGIITIDTKVIEEMLEVTGPVTVNGLTYDSSNVVLELERIASLSQREQINRKGVLGDLMEEMLVNVFESEVSAWSKLIDKAVDLAMRKHIQGYVFDEEAQALLEKYDFAGTITDPVEGDYSYVVQTNLGGDKTNWFVDKMVDHKIEKEGDRWVRTVKITYTYEQPGEEYGPFIKRFKDWVRVYAPFNSELMSIDGSEDETGTGEEKNKTYYHAYIELGPGEKKELTFKYYLPDEVVKDGKYTLLIQKQPGIDKEVHVVSVGSETKTIELEKDYTFYTKLQ